jgi:hypothetical protein
LCVIKDEHLKTIFRQGIEVEARRIVSRDDGTDAVTT